MSNFEQSNSETSRGRITKKTRQGIYKEISKEIDIAKQQEEAKKRAIKKLEEQGNGKYIMKGSNDRINGIPYQGNNENLYKTKDDKQSYHYGYTVHGQRRLEGIIWSLEKEGKIEEAMKIGYRDCEIGISEEALHNLENYSSYMEGYNAAKVGNKTRR